MPIEGEIAAGLAVHEATVTAIHGVGAGDIVGTTLTQTLTNKTLEAEVLAALLKGANILHIPTNAGWTAVVTGTGVTVQYPFLNIVTTGATVSSSAILRCYAYGFCQEAFTSDRINWNKKLYLIFNYLRKTTDTEAVGRVQLKNASALGALGVMGIGLRADNFALVGESYGTELGEVDLAVTLTTGREKQIVIVLDPSVPKIEWYVNSVLKGTQLTATKIPSGAGGAEIHIVHSINKNAATTTADAEGYVFAPKLWQAR